MLNKPHFHKKISTKERLIQKEVNVFLNQIHTSSRLTHLTVSHGLCTTPTFDTLGSVDTDTHGSTIFSNISVSPAFLKGMAFKKPKQLALSVPYEN